MISAAARNYLSYQGEMGLDEVILPEPLPSHVSRKFAGETSAKQIVQSNPPAAFFQSILKTLDGNVETPKPSKPSKPMESSPLPEFSSLSDLWDYLAKNSAALFPMEHEPGVSPMLRGTGPVHAPMALIGLEPSEPDVRAEKIFQGEAGALLEKMMRAIHVDMRGLYLTNLLKIHVPNKQWSRRELQKNLPVLMRELHLAKPSVVVLMGESCAQAVLKTGKTMDELRKVAHSIEGRDFVVTYHPEDLLRKEELKRKAWEDLQWIQKTFVEASSKS